jgi:hypothetical protein
VELDPHFASAYYYLAIALEAQGKKTEAIDRYNTFIERAPRSAQNLISTAKERSAALATGGLD